MSKRRISHQQSIRIAKKQQNYRTDIESTDKALCFDGLIIKRFSRHALVEDLHGTRVHCSIRPTLGTLVSGDRIIWQKISEQQGVIVSRYPRQSVLGRPDKHGQLKPIAANITQMIIVVAPKPEISWVLLDSYLVVAEYLQLKATILLNKTDIAPNSLCQTLTRYRDELGYSLVFAGHDQPKPNKPLFALLNHEVSVFVGQSGVGKSSLIAQILPEQPTLIAIGELSEKTELGCHTTSNSCFYHLPNGGALIDSPGVREFGLWHMSATDIATGFKEFRPFLSNCKFRDCNHQEVPGCALLHALKNKSITQQRYENYVKISTQFSK